MTTEDLDIKVEEIETPVVVESETTEVVEEESKEPTIEEQAREQGWKPKEDFEGDPEEYVSPGEFIRRGELFGKISAQSKKIRELEETFKEMGSHMKKREEIMYKKALEELSAERAAAVEDGDTEKFNKLDTEFQELKSNKPDYKMVPEEVQDLPQEVRDFQAKHKWFGGTSIEDKVMTQAAVEISNDLAAKNSNLSPDEEIKLVEKEVMKMFPHRFKNTKRTAPAAVASSSSTSSKKTDPKDWDKLSAHQKECAKRFAAQFDDYSIDDYIKDLKALGEIK